MRLVVIKGLVYQVWEGRRMLAEYLAAWPLTPEEVEELRLSHIGEAA